MNPRVEEIKNQVDKIKEKGEEDYKIVVKLKDQHEINEYFLGRINQLNSLFCRVGLELINFNCIIEKLIKEKENGKETSSID